MASKGQTPSVTEGARGFGGLLRDTLKTGLSMGEEMQRGAMEVPLAILEGFGVSKDNTNALRERNRDLVHSMVGSIDAFTSKLVEASTEQAKKVGEAVDEAVSKAGKD